MIQKYLILIICALVHISAFAEGFLAGTLVKTPSGYTEIENLVIGDQVVCYNFKGECVTRAVTHVQQEEVDAYTQIIVGNEKIFSALDHKFYISDNNTWVEAHKIKPGNALLKHCTEYISVDSVQVVEDPAVVYDITIAEFHNFCVTTEDVCVHNVLPFVAGFTLSWAYGAGFVPAISGLLGLGAFVGKALFDGLRGGAIVPNSARIDFDDELFSRLSVRPRPGYMAGKEDKDDKDKKENKDGGKKPSEPSTKPTTRPKPGEQAKPGKPTEADGFVPPRSWSGEKERHPKTGQYGWRDKHGDYWVPANDHAGAQWDVVNKNGRHDNVYPGGKIRRGSK